MRRPGPVRFRSPSPQADRQSLEYLIETGDLLDIKVLGHDDMAVHQKVRGDGPISISIIGDVEARGKRPSGLRGGIEGRLKDYIVSPSVTVNVDDTPMTIACLGEFGKPGAFPVEAGANLAHAIALAGGLTDFAARDRIFVVRQQPTPMRIRFDYEWVLRNEGGAALRLAPCAVATCWSSIAPGGGRDDRACGLSSPTTRPPWTSPIAAKRAFAARSSCRRPGGDRRAVRRPRPGSHDDAARGPAPRRSRLGLDTELHALSPRAGPRELGLQPLVYQNASATVT